MNPFQSPPVELENNPGDLVAALAAIDIDDVMYWRLSEPA